VPGERRRLDEWRTEMKKRGLAVGLAALAFLAVACGDDDDSAANSQYDAFCQAELEVEAAVFSGDPSAAEPAYEKLAAAAPVDAKQTVEKTIAAAKNMAESEGMPSEEFTSAYGELVEIVKDECGFGAVGVTAKDYEFEGIKDEVDAGATVITFDNKGSELHEILLMKLNEGVDLSAHEILELPEDEAMSKATPVAAAFSAPGAKGHTVAELEAGRYIAVCFIPVGMTPEALESGEEPQGEPHFMHGMMKEFEVA
jgi:hypothetical protein